MAYQTSSRNRSSGPGTTPSWTMPMPATMAGMAARECPVRALVVDGVEAEGDAQQRAEESHEVHQRREVARADREQLQEEGRRAAGGRGDVAGAARGGGAGRPPR